MQATAELPKEPLVSLAWYDPNSNDRTHPVATKLPNGYGVWDMLGNVWEWVQDAGKKPGEHILKGGSFYNTSRDVRVSGRLISQPHLRHRDIGFRCASSVWPEEGSGSDSLTRPDDDIAFFEAESRQYSVATTPRPRPALQLVRIPMRSLLIEPFRCLPSSSRMVAHPDITPVLG